MYSSVNKVGALYATNQMYIWVVFFSFAEQHTEVRPKLTACDLWHNRPATRAVDIPEN